MSTQSRPNRWQHDAQGLQGISALTVRILSNGAIFGDDAPNWAKAPTAQDAEEARKRAAKRLRHFAVEFPGADQLADILNQCAPGDRCKSGACPECGRAFQRWFVGQVDALAHADGGQLASVSIAFADHRVPEGQLHGLHTASMKRALAYTLAKVTGVSMVAGGIDLSLNDDSQKGLGIGWVPQFYGFVAGANVRALSDQLRNRYPKTDQAPRPVQIKTSDGSLEALSYGFKPTFVRRIAYRDPRGRWNTRKVRLHHRTMSRRCSGCIVLVFPAVCS
jgi:hypothetical protein